jgi:Peroxiredoxin
MTAKRIQSTHGPVGLRRRDFLRAAAGLAFAAGSGLGVRSAHASGLEVGKPAPPLVLHTLDGRSIATRDLRGDVVVATFWATWCDNCTVELPLLSAYAEQHAAHGLKVLGFSLDDADNLGQVKAVAASLRFPVGLLGSAWAGEYGRIWRIPVSFVIDRQGRLVDNGWDDSHPAWTEARLARIVSPLLSLKS